MERYNTPVDYKRSPENDSDEAPPPKRQRNKAMRSCEACNRRKVKCDRNDPCTTCTRMGLECAYRDRNYRPQAKPTQLKDVLRSMERLEGMMQQVLQKDDTYARAPVEGKIDMRKVLPSEKSSRVLPKGKSTWDILLNPDDVDPVQAESATTPESSPNPATLEKDQNILSAAPDTQLALRLWKIYQEAVDPVVKILHIPTTQSKFIETALDPKSAHRSSLALNFAIYYASITALFHNPIATIHVTLPSNKTVLLRRYSDALNQLLLGAEFISSPDFTGLQALAIYATCLRAHELSRKVWVITGLAIRLAQSISLHRDSPTFRLSPFDTEMRLRLWWHLCVLDSRAPEDQGFQTTIDFMAQGLRIPLNVNDDQLFPSMESLPEESNSWTEMSFAIVQTDACRIIHPFLDRLQQNEQPSESKRQLIARSDRYLSSRFGISISQDLPADLRQMAARHVDTGCKKMEFVLQMRDDKKENSSKGFGRTFIMACETLESSLMLQNAKVAPFKWFFRMYTQWYALAYVLRCLKNAPVGPEADRGWRAVEAGFPRAVTSEANNHGHGRIYKFLTVLRDEAMSLRNKVSNSGQNLPHAESNPYSNWNDLFSADQGFSPSLEMLMPEIPFLPDWDAIINGP